MIFEVIKEDWSTEQGVALVREEPDVPDSHRLR